MMAVEELEGLLGDPSFIAEAANLNAHAVFSQLIGTQPVADWLYSPNRLIRNAVRLSIAARDAATATEADRLGPLALEAARVWEALSRVAPGVTPAGALANAATLYEVAGYQANATTLGRHLASAGTGATGLTESVGLLLQRRLVALRLASPIAAADAESEDDLASSLVERGGLRALQAAALYLMSGSDRAFARAIEILDATEAVAGDVGLVLESNLLRNVRAVLPLMHQRSIWQTLSGAVDHPRWQRYMSVLARGLGQPLVNSRSVSELWPSQLAAIRGGLLDGTDSLVVRTPTSSGKTRIAELAIVKELISDPTARCLYVAPYRALVNEVAETFSACFTDLGVSSASLSGAFEDDEGQAIMGQQARVVVVTPEKLDLLSRSGVDALHDVSLVVLDEGQIVGEGDRGRRYDLLVSRLRRQLPRSRFLFLSAVVPDVTLVDFANWLQATGEPIRSGWRPAILRTAALHWADGSGSLTFEEGQGIDEALDDHSPTIVSQTVFEHIDPTTQRARRPRFPSDKGQVAAALAYELAERGPVLVSTTMPSWALSIGDSILERVNLGQLVGEAPKRAFARVEDRPLMPTSYAAAVEWLGETHRVSRLLQRGIAVHHGPLPDPVRTAIEDDFRSGRLQVLVATSTLAQGVNLPVRTVIMHSCWRSDASGAVRISARDYWNIAGRAGRAGQETSGLLVHLVLNDRDERDYRYFLAHREALDPVESALLSLLRELSARRLSPEVADEMMDPAILAMVMEEGVDPDAAVDEILPLTLCAVQVDRARLDVAPLASVMRRTARRIVAEVPDGEARRVFASTGFSSRSCQQLAQYVRDNSEQFRELLPAANLQDLDALVGLALEPLTAIPETADEADYPGSREEPVRLWLQGMTVSAIGGVMDIPTDTIGPVVEDFVAYRLPWGVTALWRIAEAELELDSLSEVSRALPAMLKYGVPTPEATWAHVSGISSRTLATLLGERFAEENRERTPAAFNLWLATQQLETLAEEYGVAGGALREVAGAIVRSRPNQLIDLLEAGELLPRNVPVRLLRSVVPASLRRLLENGDPIYLQRDYDSGVSRNSIIVAARSRRLGYLPWDLAVALAPEMDRGLVVEATAMHLQDGARGPELVVRLRT